MRSFLGKGLVLGVAIATAAATLAGCSNGVKGSAAAEAKGSVGLALQAVPGVTIATIGYVITGNGVNLTGNLDVSGASSATINGVATGTGYNIALEAVSVDGALRCTGSATFDVSASVPTSIAPHLQCRKNKGGGAGGGVGVTPTVNICPTVDALSATPDHGVVGTPIALASAASDDDNGPAALTYAWTATSGTFSDAAAAAPSFTCATAGTVTIGLTVSDSDCSDTSSFVVNCEDAPVVPVVTTASLLSGKSADCLACAQLNGCMEPTCETISGNAAAGPAAGTSRSALCLDTLTCVLAKNCASSGTGTSCYCGSVSGAGCLSPGAANGECKDVEERGLETTEPSTIATGFGDTTKGGGVANTLVQCLNDSACTSCF